MQTKEEIRAGLTLIDFFLTRAGLELNYHINGINRDVFLYPLELGEWLGEYAYVSNKPEEGTVIVYLDEDGYRRSMDAGDYLYNFTLSKNDAKTIAVGYEFEKQKRESVHY